MSESKTGVKVKPSGLYGEDLAKEKASATASDALGLAKRHSYSAPATGEKGGLNVQGPLEAIGGGSADGPSFKLYSGSRKPKVLPDTDSGD